MPEPLSCLYTVVKNTSGKSQSFTYLPPHGKTIVSNGHELVPGDVRTLIAARKGRTRDFTYFENDVRSGDLTIVSVPDHILEDSSNGDIKALHLQGGTLGTVDPCGLPSVGD